MTYRTKTYIAGEWDGDKNAIEQLYKWNDSDYWGLHFVDAHDLTQARDTSLNCSIKASLKKRLDASKTFVLVVGENTDTAKAGSCRYCSDYSSWSGCGRGNPTDLRSYIKYECDKAVEAGIKIVVLYNAAKVQRQKCPEALRYKGTHLPMQYIEDGKYYWNYSEIKKAIIS